MHWGYVIAGWSISLTAIASYAFFVIYKGRMLISKVPEERRLWSTSRDEEPVKNEPPKYPLKDKDNNSDG